MGSTLNKQENHLNVEPFLLEVADVMSTSLDLDTTLRRVAEIVQKVIDYEIFAILLLNEKTQELRFRFQVGYPPEYAERARVKVGEGVTGQSAQLRQTIFVDDVTKDPRYIAALPNVCSELAVPLIAKNRVIGVIDLEARQTGYFTEEHSRLLTLLASRIASGIENAQLYTRTTRQARILGLLNDIARELSSILNLDELLSRVAELLRKLIDYQMFSILLLDSSGEKLQHRFSLRFNENIHLKHEVPLGRGLVGHAAQSGQAILVPDVTKDPRYVEGNPETRSELAVPLIYKDKVIGVLDLEHTRRGFFTDDHRRTMMTLAAQVAIAIENARLYEEIARQERRLERDLALARELQMRLLPQARPKLAHLDVAAKFIPARAIGGDLYDFIPYSLSRLGIVIGDVSGKGAPAAIYAALVSGILRSHAPIEPGPAEMLKAVNMSLAERRIEAQFVSLIYAVWEDENSTLLVSNSGLPRPVYVHDGKNQVIEATGLPLGLFDDADYDEFTFRMKPGDMFVFFSDGILDARNRKGELLGRGRVEKIIEDCAGKSADCVVDSLFKAAAEHSAGVEAFDDQTVVAIKVKDGSATGSVKRK
ncbi:MAG TPA: GAF domain-containing protein [Candidatus Dormibacteraeota bacterium]|jgi:sigma-B regulation protein RsbU (phosphoserine phosphatase)|nr:GAF domain-containing protein [Candidatus Dormibacteraeota bacterium]